VHPRFRAPSTATLVAGVATAVFYVGMTLISENVLIDTIYRARLMICFLLRHHGLRLRLVLRHEPRPQRQDSSSGTCRCWAR
jgi:hypothetical protein